MRKQRGFTIIELLIVVAVIGIIAAIAIPSLLRVRVSSLAAPFKTHFGVDITVYASARVGEEPNQWLTAEQKTVLRPYVAKRLAELCATPTRTTPDASPAMDPAAVQLRLQAVSREGSTAEAMAKACTEARAVVLKLGVIPAEAQ